MDRQGRTERDGKSYLEGSRLTPEPKIFFTSLQFWNISRRLAARKQTKCIFKISMALEKAVNFQCSCSLSCDISLQFGLVGFFYHPLGTYGHKRELV